MRNVTLALCLLVGIADAGVAVVATGEPTAQGPIEGLLKAWLSEHAFEVEDALQGDAKTTLLNCLLLEDLKCARGAFEARSPSTNLVYIRADLEPGDGPNYTLTTYWFVKGRDPAVDKRRCTSCDAAALAQAVDDLMAALRGAVTVEKGRVKITARSDGTVVWIDNVKHGVAPLERDLDPGPHELKFTARGRTLGTQTVSVESGRTIEVASPLTEVASPQDDGGARPVPWGPVALLGGGGAAAVVGGVFLYYGTLGGPNERYVYDDAMSIGLPIALVGGAAIAAGGVLFARQRDGRSSLGTSLVGGGVAIAAIGGMFLHYGSLGGPDERYVYDNATKIGLPLTLVGGAAIIAGSVLFGVRGRHATTSVVTATSNQVHVKLVGSF